MIQRYNKHNIVRHTINKAQLLWISKNTFSQLGSLIDENDMHQEDIDNETVDGFKSKLERKH